MITTLQSFFITAVFFLILSPFLGWSIWKYFISVTLVVVIIVLKLYAHFDKNKCQYFISKHSTAFSEFQKEILEIAPSLFLSQKQYYTFFIKADPSAAVGWATILSAILFIYSLVVHQWLIVALSVATLIYLTFTKIKATFPTFNNRQDLNRLYYFYSRAKQIKPLSEFDKRKLALEHENINKVINNLLYPV